MSHQQYEVEIKSLLGPEEKAIDFKKRLIETTPGIKIRSICNQLNHYFEGGDPEKLYRRLEKHFNISAKKELKKILLNGSNISVRTRKSDGEVKFVVKASLGEDSSHNGVIRVEFEKPIKLSLEALDKEIQKAGYTYQAKWSRLREEFQIKDMTVCFDRNAGYGYLVEFEKVLKKREALEGARKEILGFMRKLKVYELEQKRLERMFAHYNKNWNQYYGTSNVFTLN